MKPSHVAVLVLFFPMICSWHGEFNCINGDWTYKKGPVDCESWTIKHGCGGEVWECNDTVQSDSQENELEEEQDNSVEL